MKIKIGDICLLRNGVTVIVTDKCLRYNAYITAPTHDIINKDNGAIIKAGSSYCRLNPDGTNFFKFPQFDVVRVVSADLLLED